MLRLIMTTSQDVTYTLHRVVSLIDKIADDVLQKKLQMTFAQFKVLMALETISGCQKDIADFWNMTEAAVSRQIDLLVQAQLITRQENQENRRQNKLILSHKGKKNLKKAYGYLEKKYDEVYNVWTDKEKTGMNKSLCKVLTSLCTSHNMHSVKNCT